MTIVAPVNAGTATVSLLPYSSSRNINIESGTTAGVLSLTGFVVAPEGAAVQPPAAVAGIAVAFTLVPAALAGLGAVVLLRVGR